MDSSSISNSSSNSLNQKKATKKQAKKTTNKNKPLKVVYITNPIKFNTSASEFRALVQELTGQDAADVSPPDVTKFSDSDTSSVGGGRAEVADGVTMMSKMIDDDVERQHAGGLVEAPSIVRKSGGYDADPTSFSTFEDENNGLIYDRSTVAASGIMEEFANSSGGNSLWHDVLNNLQDAM